MKKMNNILYLTTVGVISSITPTISNAQTFYQCMPTVCPAGQYKDRSGTCVKCPAGTANPYEGETSANSCQRCSGYGYAPNEGMSNCKNFSYSEINVFYGVGASYNALYPNKIMCAGSWCGNDKHTKEYWCDNTMFAPADEGYPDPAPSQKKYCGLSINQSNFGGCNSKTAITGGGCMNSTYYFASENKQYYVDTYSNVSGAIRIWGDLGSFLVYPNGTVESYNPDADAK
ncbi:MAG: hypothetical protein ACI4N3_03845 [Alphaproteobacteria bacterium]